MPGGIDLFYIGGGQDRDQELVAADLAAQGAGARARRPPAAPSFLGVCGGYQLLGRSYRDRAGAELPGVGLLPLQTVAGERRMIGDVLIDCDWAGADARRLREPRRPHDPRPEGAEPLGRVVAGFGNDGGSGFEGCRAGRVYGTYLHGPLLPRNPWFADRLLAEALAHETGGGRARAARRRARARGPRRRRRPRPRRAAAAAPSAIQSDPR